MSKLDERIFKITAGISAQNFGYPDRVFIQQECTYNEAKTLLENLKQNHPDYIVHCEIINYKPLTFCFKSDLIRFLCKHKNFLYKRLPIYQYDNTEFPKWFIETEELSWDEFYKIQEIRTCLTQRDMYHEIVDLVPFLLDYTNEMVEKNFWWCDRWHKLERELVKQLKDNCQQIRKLF